MRPVTSWYICSGELSVSVAALVSYIDRTVGEFSIQATQPPYLVFLEGLASFGSELAPVPRSGPALDDLQCVGGSAITVRYPHLESSIWAIWFEQVFARLPR